ncbi:MAG TPA: hypothetical protein DDW76_14015, partial [Cyanobacteria bacterium UBA11369]|nr:hypothetical protein [Cyanobacteria bacterium UBA11369]
TQSKTLALPLLKDMILQQIAFCVRYSPLAKECNSGTLKGAAIAFKAPYLIRLQSAVDECRDTASEIFWQIQIT